MISLSLDRMPFKHADGTLKNRDHRQHRRDTEGNARDANQRAHPVPPQIGKINFKKIIRRVKDSRV